MPTQPNQTQLLDIPGGTRNLLIFTAVIGLIIAVVASLEGGKDSTLEVDKILHFVGYGALAMVLVLALRPKVYIPALLGLIALGVAIEFIQPLNSRGFEIAEHPWQDRYRDRAHRIVQEKSRPGSEKDTIPSEADQDAARLYFKAAGQLAQAGTVDFLSHRDPGRPFFIFLNYMEAHFPYVPAEEYRKRFTSPEQVDRSYRTHLGFDDLWAWAN